MTARLATRTMKRVLDALSTPSTWLDADTISRCWPSGSACQEKVVGVEKDALSPDGSPESRMAWISDCRMALESPLTI
jgi:hypothetical protein